MGFAKRFPSLDEALEWVRQAVDEESRLEADYQRGLRELRDALESTPLLVEEITFPGEANHADSIGQESRERLQNG